MQRFLFEMAPFEEPEKRGKMASLACQGGGGRHESQVREEDEGGKIECVRRHFCYKSQSVVNQKVRL
jgi:hypothetical protein